MKIRNPKIFFDELIAAVRFPSVRILSSTHGREVEKRCKRISRNNIRRTSSEYHRGRQFLEPLAILRPLDSLHDFDEPGTLDTEESLRWGCGCIFDVGVCVYSAFEVPVYWLEPVLADSTVPWGLSRGTYRPVAGVLYYHDRYPLKPEREAERYQLNLKEAA